MRSRLSQTAEYAMRAMLEITRAPAGARITRGAIAEKTNVPTSAMAQVLAVLVRAQLLVAQPGPRGGYRLAKPAGKISVFDILAAIDANHTPQECVLHDRSCHSLNSDYCAFHELFVNAERQFLRSLQATSILEIVRIDDARRATLETQSRPEAEADVQSDELTVLSDDLFYSLARAYS